MSRKIEHPGTVRKITARSLRSAIFALSQQEPRFATIVERHGPPPLWPREPGFATLALLLLEQQVSLAQARAMFGRVVAAAGVMTPHAVHALGVEGLKAIGVTRQKSAYLHGLASTVVEGRFDFGALEAMDDDAATQALDALHGIGHWTAQCYLLFALGRPDVFPAADIGLMDAAHQVFRLRARPTPEALMKRSEAWRPYRAVAARLLWHHYLSVRGRSV